MCGLVGLITSAPLNFAEDKRKFFKQALYADVLRGVDSTGTFMVDDKNSTYTYKRALAAYDFIEGWHFKRLLGRTSLKVAMGHNRAATKGGVYDSTAHPFTYGNFVVCHNGTLYNHRTLEGGSKFDVDSEYIAYSFDKFGVEETLKNIRGAFALTWYNKETKKFYAVRNSERELSYAYNQSKNTLMYASEGEMLAWVASRNSLELHDNAFYSFEEGYLYEIDPETLKITSREVEFAPKYTPPANTAAANRTAGGQTSTGTTGNASRTSPQATTFIATLAYLGLEMNEDIFINFTGTSAQYAFFKFPPWYDLPKHAKVVVRQYSFVTEYLNKHRDEFFKAKITGCRYDHVTNTYIVYIKEAAATGEDYSEKKPDEEDCAPEVLLLPGPNNKDVEAAEWNKLTKHGCDNCGAGIPEADAKYMRWSVSGTPICCDCVMSYFLQDGKTDLQGLIEE